MKKENILIIQGCKVDEDTIPSFFKKLPRKKVIAEIFLENEHTLKVEMNGFNGEDRKNILREIKKYICKNRIYKESKFSLRSFLKNGSIEIGDVDGDNFLESLRIDITVSLLQKSLILEGYEVSYYGGVKMREKKKIRKK